MRGGFFVCRNGRGMTMGVGRGHGGDRLTKDTSDYDPNFTTRGTPRKRQIAPTKAQQKKRALKERQEAMANLPEEGMIGKMRRYDRKKGKDNLKYCHMYLSTEQIEWIAAKAFREGVTRAEWVRRILDAVRMADMGVTGDGKYGSE